MTFSPSNMSLQPQQQQLENVLPEKLLLGLSSIKWVPYTFLDVVNKVNKVGKVQQRVIMLTATHGYSCLATDGDIQRCFPLSAVEEVMVYQRGNEVAFVMPSEYDYLMQMRGTASLQQLMNVVRGMKVTESSTPLQRSANLRLEKPQSYSKAAPASVTVSYPRCYRQSRVGKATRSSTIQSSSIYDPAATSPASAQKEGKLRYDSEVANAAATADAAEAFERHIEDEKQKEWDEVEFQQPDGTMSPAVVSSPLAAPPQTGGPIVPQREGTARSLTSPPQMRHRDDSPIRHTDPALMKPMRQSDPFYPEVTRKDDGTAMTLEEQLVFERIRNTQYRKMMAELIAAERESSAVLREIIDDLRLEVDRLSVENMKLKHPAPDY